MKNQSSQGSRRRYRRGGNSSRPSGERNGYSAKPAKPLTFWERILAFFQGDNKPKTSPASSRTPSTSTPERRETRKQEEPNRESRSSRKPEVVEVTSTRLYVGNLSFDATESDLQDLFNGVGEVQSAEIVSHRHTQRSKGFAFVQMNTVDEARRAVEVLHDKEFLGRKLVVSGAKRPDAQDDRGESRFAA